MAATVDKDSTKLEITSMSIIALECSFHKAPADDLWLRLSPISGVDD